MKFKDLFRRTCAITLAVACFMSSTSFLPIEKLIAWASTTPTFEFYFKSNVSGKLIDDGPAHILEGVPIYVEDYLKEYSVEYPGTYTYYAGEPFSLGDTTGLDKDVAKDFLLLKTATGDIDAYIQPVIGLTDNYSAAKAVEFQLNPIVQYSLTSGSMHEVSLSYKGQSYLSDALESDNYDKLGEWSNLNTTINAQLSIETGSINLTNPTNKLTFEYVGDETVKNYEREKKFDTGTNTTSSVETWYSWGQAPKDGWQITEKTGFFEGYIIDDVGFSLDVSGTEGENRNIATFTLQKEDKKEGDLWLKVVAYYTDLGRTHRVDDMKFSFDFTYQTTEDRLSFQIKNRQDAVDEIAQRINPVVGSGETTQYVTVPEYSTSGLQYLQNNYRPFIHAQGYTLGEENSIVLNDIQNDFYLKTRHSEFNYTHGFYITWDWVPHGIVDPGTEPVAPKEVKRDIDPVTGLPMVDGAGNEIFETDQEWEARLSAYQTAKNEYDKASDEYKEIIQDNLEKENVIVLPDFQIVDTDGDGIADSWLDSVSTSNGRDIGRITADVNVRTVDTPGKLIATVHVFDDVTFATAPKQSGTNIAGDEIIYSDKSEFYDGRGYNKAISSAQVEIPITITGRGVDPAFYITSATMATYNDDNYTYNTNGQTFTYEAGEQEEFPVFKDGEEVKIGTSGSVNMDINNGIDGINTPPADIPVGYVPPIPMAPHKVQGSIDFGSGIKQSDRLVITNNTVTSSTASILMQYHLSDNNDTVVSEYEFTTYGETWEIPIETEHFGDNDEKKYVYNFSIYAKDEGMFNMSLDFYNGSSTYPITKRVAIQIGSSLPSSEATIDKIYMHLIQDVEDPNNLTEEEKRVEEVLNDLYSDKGSLAANNPLRGQMPTEIIYNIDFTYDPSGYYYYEVELPYVISDVMLTPIYSGIAQSTGALNMTATDPLVPNSPYTITGNGYDTGDYYATTGEMDLIEERNSPLANKPTSWIEISTLAADIATSEKYYLKIIRQDAESIVVLDDLYVDTTDLIGDNISLPLQNAFGTEIDFVTDPIGVGARYYITLPYFYYSQEIPVNITAISNGDWAKSPTIVSDEGLSTQTGFFSNFFNNLSNKTTESYVLDYQDTYGAGTNAAGSSYPNKFTITTYSEANNEYSEYYLTIFIAAPDKNDDLTVLEVLDPSIDDTVIPFKNGNFVPNKNDYIIEIPYELQKYRFSVLPDSDNALAVRLVAPDGTVLGTTTYANPGTPIQFLIDFAELGLKSTDLNFTFTLAVQSEDGVWSDQYNHPEGHSPYTILFQRDEPNSDSLLSDLSILDFETATPLPEYVFEQVKKDYIFTVPYTTERIILKPIANEQERTTITINGVDFPDEDPGKDYYLTAGDTNHFVIVVTAEDKTYTTTYNLYITRANPDNEARLLNLVVNGADSMTPELFVPSTYTYDVTIPAGTETYTVTPTAVSEYSVIIIDGIVIPSGTPTAPYHAVDEDTVINVYVSAQDGETVQIYTLNIKNHNLIEKSDDAVLLDVNIQGVDIEPKFLSNVYDYEVYTKIDTTLLSITPKVSPGATVSVSVGSKKLDEINGIYSTSFFTDTDAITITVTSESGNVSKDYKFAVYKNTEDKEGIFKPITDEDVDFNGANPIVVDISEYAVVDASVFNTMKEKYPDKTIVFTGNDYMIRIQGSQITENIPHTVQYDFGFSFTSPEEPLVQSILDGSDVEEDAELEPIYLYFNGHGALPGQMVLTAVLGSSVGDSQLYWNYYNTERDRIDYYGYVQSNSKGTITVPMAHMSTYLVTTSQIGASEDRTNTGFGSLDLGNHSSGQSDGSIGTEGLGDDLTGSFGNGGSGTGTGSNGDISGDMNTNKPNPQTDVYGNPITNTGGVVYEQTTVYKWIEEKRNKRQKEEFVEC